MLSEFFHMGGYAIFVWSSYGVFGAVMAWTAVAPLLRRRRMLRNLKEREALLARKGVTS